MVFMNSLGEQDTNGTLKRRQKPYCPIHLKYALTIEEAAAYFNIGEKTIIRSLTDYYDEDSAYLLQVGKKRLVKRVAFENYLNERESI